MERGAAIEGSRVRIGLLAQQETAAVDIVDENGVYQRGGPLVVHGLKIGAGVDQRVYDFELLLVGGEVERRLLVFGTRRENGLAILVEHLKSLGRIAFVESVEDRVSRDRDSRGQGKTKTGKAKA